MRLFDLFNYSKKPESGLEGGPGTPPKDQTGGAFITPQTIVTFPVASSVLFFLWGIAKKLSPGIGEQDWVGLVIALLIGALIYLVSVSDPKIDPRQRAIGIAIGLINSAYLFAAAVGITKVP